MPVSKYQPLADFLQRSPSGSVRLSFARIERILGCRLPPSARRYRAWWSNNRHNRACTRVWLAAGWRTQDVDMGAQLLNFVRGDVAPEKVTAAFEGWWARTRGLVRVQPGWDLARPALPAWAGLVEARYGRTRGAGR